MTGFQKERMSEAIKSSGLTLDQLEVKTGVAQSTLSNYRRGTIPNPQLPQILALQGELGFSLDWLFGISDQKAKPTMQEAVQDLKTAAFTAIYPKLSQLESLGLIKVSEGILEGISDRLETLVEASWIGEDGK